MAAVDTLIPFPEKLTSPPTKAFAVTLHDTDELAFVTRSIWVGVGGDVAVIYWEDTVAVNLKNVPSGTRVSGRFKVIKSTGTTATNIIAEY